MGGSSYSEKSEDGQGAANHDGGDGGRPLTFLRAWSCLQLVHGHSVLDCQEFESHREPAALQVTPTPELISGLLSQPLPAAPPPACAGPHLPGLSSYFSDRPGLLLRLLWAAPRLAASPIPVRSLPGWAPAQLGSPRGRDAASESRCPGGPGGLGAGPAPRIPRQRPFPR